jgi:hypothetical protein
VARAVGDARGRRRERARRARRAVIDGDDAGLYDAAARRARKGVEDARARLDRAKDYDRARAFVVGDGAREMAALEARASGGDPIEKALAASGDEDERDD